VNLAMLPGPLLTGVHLNADNFPAAPPPGGGGGAGARARKSPASGAPVQQRVEAEQKEIGGVLQSRSCVPERRGGGPGGGADIRAEGERSSKTFFLASSSSLRLASSSSRFFFSSSSFAFFSSASWSAAP